MTAIAPIHTLTSFNISPNTPARALAFNLADMATFPVSDPAIAGYPDDGWSSTSGSKAIPRRINTRTDALDAVQSFVLPADDIATARRNARRLTNLMQTSGSPETVRRLPTGRLDMPRVIRRYDDLAAGRVSDDAALIYKRRAYSAPKRPHVAVVADGSWRAMWEDEDHVPRVTALSLGVQWAAEAAGIDCTAALTNHMMRFDNPYTLLAITIAGTGRRIPTSALATCYHRDMYRCAYLRAGTASAALYRDLKLKTKDGWNAWNSSSSAGTGGRAVAYARNVLNADLVIAIGNVTDKDKADIIVGAKSNLEAALATIAARMDELNRKRAA